MGPCCRAGAFSLPHIAPDVEVFCCLTRVPPLGKTPPTPFSPPALPCPPPPVIAHATHSAELGANFSSGMAVNYSCQPGFSLLGASSIWCTATGNWSRPYPRCAGEGPPWMLLGPASCPPEKFGGDCTPRDPHGSKLAAGTHRVLALVALGISWWHCQGSCVPTGRWSQCSHI